MYGALIVFTSCDDLKCFSVVICKRGFLEMDNGLKNGHSYAEGIPKLKPRLGYGPPPLFSRRETKIILELNAEGAPLETPSPNSPFWMATN
jgi:hypothetical protein